MIRVVAASRIYNDKIDEYYKTVKELIEETNKEEGCIYYTLNKDAKDPAIHYMSEGWTDREALERHIRSPHFTRIVPALGQYVESRPMEMLIMEEVEL
ncbi:MAG: antibiotic biosynthesis monooxygenase [Solobacterium sp.]|nr:antibiotic biosynthesis monooxygenase [Solobacterium sp.]